MPTIVPKKPLNTKPFKKTKVTNTKLNLEPTTTKKVKKAKNNITTFKRVSLNNKGNFNNNFDNQTSNSASNSTSSLTSTATLDKNIFQNLSEDLSQDFSPNLDTNLPPNLPPNLPQDPAQNVAQNTIQDTSQNVAQGSQPNLAKEASPSSQTSAPNNIAQESTQKTTSPTQNKKPAKLEQAQNTPKAHKPSIGKIPSRQKPKRLLEQPMPPIKEDPAKLPQVNTNRPFISTFGSNFPSKDLPNQEAGYKPYNKPYKEHKGYGGYGKIPYTKLPTKFNTFKLAPTSNFAKTQPQTKSPVSQTKPEASTQPKAELSLAKKAKQKATKKLNNLLSKQLSNWLWASAIIPIAVSILIIIIIISAGAMIMAVTMVKISCGEFHPEASSTTLGNNFATKAQVYSTALKSFGVSSSPYVGGAVALGSDLASGQGVDFKEAVRYAAISGATAVGGPLAGMAAGAFTGLVGGLFGGKSSKSPPYVQAMAQEICDNKGDLTAGLCPVGTTATKPTSSLVASSECLDNQIGDTVSLYKACTRGQAGLRGAPCAITKIPVSKQVVQDILKPRPGINPETAYFLAALISTESYGSRAESCSSETGSYGSETGSCGLEIWSVVNSLGCWGPGQACPSTSGPIVESLGLNEDYSKYMVVDSRGIKVCGKKCKDAQQAFIDKLMPGGRCNEACKTAQLQILQAIYEDKKSIANNTIGNPRANISDIPNSNSKGTFYVAAARWLGFGCDGNGTCTPEYAESALRNYNILTCNGGGSAKKMDSSTPTNQNLNLNSSSTKNTDSFQSLRAYRIIPDDSSTTSNPDNGGNNNSSNSNNNSNNNNSTPNSSNKKLEKLEKPQKSDAANTKNLANLYSPGSTSYSSSSLSSPSFGLPSNILCIPDEEASSTKTPKNPAPELNKPSKNSTPKLNKPSKNSTPQLDKPSKEM